MDNTDRQSALVGSVALAADHAGFHLKEHLKAVLQGFELRVTDLGTDSPDSTDYPAYGHAVAREIAEGRVDCGVLVCGTGIGMSIAANRHKGVRAAVCHSPEEASYSRSNNDANILCLGGRIISTTAAEGILTTFLTTRFEGGRHERRVRQLEL
ncbi:MAG: ribose 5-phosphate isomerase B [Candidatus Neomarinimicrobiota bacterium]